MRRDSKKSASKVILSFLVVFTPFALQAQTDEGAPASFSSISSEPGEMDAIEQLFVEDGRPTNEIIDDGARRNQQQQKTETQTKSSGSDFKEVSDLNTLSEFKDIAVIQKRYLPKTQRFEAFIGAGGILNDKFFSSVSLNGRLGYSFSERFGVEILGMAMATWERTVTQELRARRGVLTTSFVSPQSYYGLDIKWTPVYGKMSFVNRKITPFDLYFSAGGGITNTNQGHAEPTVHIATGQVFAITKSAAFRWDFSWNFYNARSGVAGAKQNSTYNNLFLSLGASFFFPAATYR
jgi:outer membrane beta-barrel protein